jgi:Ca-activated chloride channel family protein
LEAVKYKPWLKFTILMLSLGLIIVALARPQFASETKANANENVEIFFALDISNSMLAESQNSSISRLDYAKSVILRSIDKLDAHKIGLVGFAGQAVMLIPITHDYSAFKLLIQSVNPSYLSDQGTDIADALNLSINSFSQNENSQKYIVLISDGEDHEGNIEQACDDAKKAGIKIFTIGIGSTRGEPIYLDGQLMKDKDGNVVISKLNETILLKIAKSTNADYYNLSTNSKAIDQVLSSIKNNTKDGKTKVSKMEDKFHYFLLPALILLLLESLILNRQNRWLAKLKIFSKQQVN